MFLKNHRNFILVALFTFAACLPAIAQNAPISGKIELQKADGTKTPVAGAVIEVYRTDIKSKGSPSKSDKKGQFNFVGLQLGGSYILSVSAAGAKPTFLVDIKAGSENLLITLAEGDGAMLTEDQVRESAKGPAPTNTSEAGGKPVELTAAQKKDKAEYDKKVAEVKAKNEDVKNKYATISKALTDGNKAFNEKNYDAALALYDQGIQADPTFLGTAPVLLNNKALTLKLRGIDLYNKSVKTTDPAEKAAESVKAKKDLTDSLAAYTSALTILKSGSPTEATEKANYDKTNYDTLSGLTEVYRLLVITKTGITKPADAKEAFDSYLTVETDAAKKGKAQITFGDVMLESGETDMALTAYQAALVTAPDNPDALVGAGLSLVNLGYINEDKAKFQEGTNYLQKFISVAPANHKLKNDAEALIETLKKEQNVAPQKGGAKKKT